MDDIAEILIRRIREHEHELGLEQPGGGVAPRHDPQACSARTPANVWANVKASPGQRAET